MEKENLIELLIKWFDSHQGFSMVLLTAAYVVTTFFILKSGNKTLKVSIQQKEQGRVIASLDLIRKLNALFNNPPVHQSDADFIKEKLSLLQGEISALGGIDAYMAYKKIYDFLNTLGKTTDKNVFDDIVIKQEICKRYLELENCFRSEAVAKQKIKYKSIGFWKKIFKKQEILNLPLVETAFQFGWISDTSHNGVLGVPASKGQCAVTAMVIQDYFGGDIYKIKVGNESHYFNVIKNKIVDLTSDQFFQTLDYKGKVIANRNNFEPETINRYKILKSRVEPFLINVGVLKKGI